LNSITRQDADKLVASIGIPPRPVIVIAIQDEKARTEPDLMVIADIISRDVGLSAALLKAVNSPLYGIAQRVQSIAHAVNLLGLSGVMMLVNALALKTTLNTHGIERFWDQSTRTALVSAWLAEKFGHHRDTAYLFGLFRDAAIPLLMNKFKDYKDTLRLANQPGALFTQVEDQRHGVNHTQVGSIIARNWKLAEEIRIGILRHHDETLFTDPSVDGGIKNLVAVSHLAGNLENQHTRHQSDAEWDRMQDALSAWLMLGEDDLVELSKEASSLLLEAGL